MPNASRRCLALVASLLVAIACACGNDTARPSAAGRPEPASAATRARIEELRMRFPLSRATARGFETREGRLQPLFTAAAKRAVRHAVTLALPARATGWVELADDETGAAVAFAPTGVRDVAVATSDGVALYAGAVAGNDLLHVPGAEGTEDFVAFEAKPEREEISYAVDVARIAGLRLVSNTLEFLDGTGAPRLRVAPPGIVDAAGIMHEATLAVGGCAYDEDPRPPWGRAVVRPGASACSVRVSWTGVTYPAMLDPTWTATGSLGTGRQNPTASLLGSGRVLVAGGSTSSGTASSAELYDPTAGTFAATGAMGSARTTFTATVLESGKVLVAGGVNGSTITSTAELYDPSAGTFAPTGHLVAARDQHTATLLSSGKVLMAAGLVSSGETSSAEIYDPTTASFAATGSLGTARRAHSATLLSSGKVLAVGGTSPSALLSSAELYDPNSGTFSSTGAMITPREFHTATLLSTGKVLIAGGTFGSALAGAELYDPVAGAFTSTGPMTAGRYSHTAALLRSGRVVVAGGLGGVNNTELSSAEVYDPGAGAFATGGTMVTPRTWHAGVVLASGNVLLLAGYDGANVLSSAELYVLSAPGSSCTTGADCASGICDDNVCCTSACPNNGVCQTCRQGSGACAPVVDNADPDTCAGTMRCDATGACKLATGQACPGGASTCASGFCADGFCCNAACGSACDVCAASLGATANGACTPAPVGSAGSPACPNGGACDGTDVTCIGPCTSDVDCLLSDYCAANGTCVARKAQGTSCNQAAGADCATTGCRDCASGFCVDGVCCDTACNTLCQACSAALKQSGTTDGTCDSAKAQTNPHHDNCPTSPPTSCGPDGLCSGAGACSLFYPAGTSCGPTACNSSNGVDGPSCDGNGGCTSKPKSCGDYVCSSGTCPTTCTSDADCVGTAYCAAHSCVPRGPDGGACTAADQCASGFCVDGVCCNSACSGQCEACDGATTKGTCTAISGAPHGRRAQCPTAQPGEPCSGATCDGATATSCTGYPGALVPCGAATCTMGVETLPGACDGTGHCKVPPTVLCGSFACGASACNTTCRTDSDCAAGNKCDVTTGKCTSGATCGADGHTTTGANGTVHDCAPFACGPDGACITKCQSVVDCASPNVCDPTGACVAPPSAGGGGGCSAAPGTSRTASGCVLLILGMIVAAIRRTQKTRDVRHRIGAPIACVSILLFAASCTQGEVPSASADAGAPVTAAGARLAELRARFRYTGGSPSAGLAVIGPGRATRFERVGNDRYRPEVDKRGVRKPATVSLPARAAATIDVVDDTSGRAMRFALHGAKDVAAAFTDGVAVYAGALGGADLIHRPHAEGTEDFVVFEARPPVEEIAYDLDVATAAGLRLVSNTLEVLDDEGTPRLRVDPPSVVDAAGASHPAILSVDGCAYDVDPRAPWGRPVVGAGAKICLVRVRWSGVDYPAIVDPSWVATGSMAVTRSNHTSTALSSGKVLVAGGDNGSTYFSEAELYDPAAGTFAATGTMTSARSIYTATMLASGKVLLVGGYGTGGVNESSAELYDPSKGTFAGTGSMASPRVGHTASVLGSGKVLVAGGSSNSANTDQSTSELYDPSAGTFSSTGSMAAVRAFHTASVLASGKVLVAGGNDAGAISGAELYDPTTGTYTSTGNMIAARSHHAANVLSSGKVLVTGGQGTSGANSTAELFDPSTVAFSATGAMASPRSHHTATVLATGKVLVAGGFTTGLSVVQGVELYDPAAGTFASTSPMAAPRAAHAASVLSSGRVLVSGGYEGGAITFSTAEVYALALPGTACTTGDECGSGMCNENCCAASCSGACTTCAATTGACTTVKNATDPDSCTGTMVCDGSGSCKLATAQPCPGGASTCATGFCSDGVCCSTACAGACDVCTAALGATADGTCATAPVGYGGNPACPNGGACDGTSVTCVSPCGSDGDCLATDYCSVNGSCQPRKAQGASCNEAAGVDCKVAGCRSCASDHCVDGVCCDTACNTLCQACAAPLKQSGTGDGVCGDAKAQTNPHHDACPMSAPATCGADGLCSGAGGCSLFYPAGTSCGATTCNATNTGVVGQSCDGNGTCSSAPQSCGNYLCANGTCPSTCATDAECAPTAFCDQHACVPKGANGSGCAAANACVSGFCVDGVCCSSACSGQCEACDGATTKGTCAPVVGAPHGARAACSPPAPGDPCSAVACDGITAASCAGYAGASVSCGAASCAAGVETLAGACDGTGHCKVPPTVACGTYACGAAACKTSCKTDADCSATNKCDVSTGKCVSAATCGADGHTATSASGTVTDCAPFNCQSDGTCLTHCGSVSDCAVPNVCSPDRICVAPPSGGGDSSGCSTSTGHGGDVPPGVALAAVLLVGARRRRARRAA